MNRFFIILYFTSFVNAFLTARFGVGFREPLKLNSFKMYRKYPLSQYHHERYIKRLNSKNYTVQNNEILGTKEFEELSRLNELRELYNTQASSTFWNILNKLNTTNQNDDDDDDDKVINDLLGGNDDDTDFEQEKQAQNMINGKGIRIIFNKDVLQKLSDEIHNSFNDTDNADEFYDPYGNRIRTFGASNRGSTNKKSDNFEVIMKSPINFTDIGGYDNIKQELYQCIDILSNYSRYAPYNVRVPKGLIFEGPPGNGKTLLAKALAGEAKTGFIAVSGSEFQEKYVGVGASRIRELFKLAKENVPCIIFIDEIDALGRKRSSEGDTSGNERDSTLNELLVALDGFKNTSGIFVIGATNRADLLDTALTRPGRIDKRIFIGNPDAATRRAILGIHSKGKPYDQTVIMEDMVEMTKGLSGAQIENLLNEAMLNALRNARTAFNAQDVDEIMNKIMVGWQPNEHQFTTDMIDQIAIHELGHAVVGLLSKHHSKMTKVIINLSSPNTPAYTVFEGSTTSILTREALFEHLMILLAGRIAEEVFYDVSVTTGAMNDFEEALKLAERMITYYGMGKQAIYPSTSEKYKQMVDDDVAALINDAYGYAEFIIRNSKDLITEGANILKQDKTLKADTLIELMNMKYRNVLSLKI